MQALEFLPTQTSQSGSFKKWHPTLLDYCCGMTFFYRFRWVSKVIHQLGFLLGGV